MIAIIEEIKRLFLNTIFKNKVRTISVFSFCILLITVICYVEKTKQITQYGLVYHHMGSTCEGECGQDKRLKYFHKAVYHNPNLSDAHYQLALIYEEKGEHGKALEFFQRVTELDYSNILAFYRVGVKYFKEGAYEYALRYFLQAIRGGGYPEDIRYYLARIYDQRKEYDLAFLNYRNIVWSNPKYADEVYPRLVEMCLFLDDSDSIVREITHLRWADKHDLADQLEKVFKSNKVSDYKVGRQYFEEGKYESALKHFLQVIQVEGGYPEDIRYYLARIYDQRKEYDLAILNYKNIVWSNPKYADEVYPRLVEMCLFLNNEYAIVKEITHLRWADRHDLADQLEKTFKAAQASEASHKE